MALEQIAGQRPDLDGPVERTRTKAYLVLTEGGAILVLTNYPGIGDQRLTAMLRRKGLHKFIAYPVPLEHVRQLYGVPFEVIAAELQRVQGVRVLDYDGARIFRRFSLSALDSAYLHEA